LQNNLPIAGDTEIGGLADRFIAKHPQSAAPNDKSQNPRQSGTNPPRDPTKDNLNMLFQPKSEDCLKGSLQIPVVSK